jgi:hypothetical protein
LKARGFVLGLIAGGLGGLLSLTWAVGVPFLGPLAIVVGCLIRPRPTGAGGTLIGWGATWLVLFARVAGSCSTDRDCGGGPDIEPWMAAGVGLILVGLALLAAAYRRRDGHRPEPS